MWFPRFISCSGICLRVNFMIFKACLEQGVVMNCVSKVWMYECASIQGRTFNLQAVWVQLCCDGNWEWWTAKALAEAAQGLAQNDQYRDVCVCVCVFPDSFWDRRRGCSSSTSQDNYPLIKSSASTTGVIPAFLRSCRTESYFPLFGRGMQIKLLSWITRMLAS